MVVCGFDLALNMSVFDLDFTSKLNVLGLNLALNMGVLDPDLILNMCVFDLCHMTLTLF